MHHSRRRGWHGWGEGCQEEKKVLLLYIFSQFVQAQNLKYNRTFLIL